MSKSWVNCKWGQRVVPGHIVVAFWQNSARRHVTEGSIVVSGGLGRETWAAYRVPARGPCC